jgi:predicted transcriptional regulator
MPLDKAKSRCQTFLMDVQFTSEQEQRLAQIASLEGIAPARLVQEAALQLLAEDERFRVSVRKGLKQADQGIFVDDAEMHVRLSRLTGD